MNNWHNFTLMQIARDVSEIKARIAEVATWAQRLALLAMLWGAGLVANLSAEDKGAIIGAVIKSLGR